MLLKDTILAVTMQLTGSQASYAPIHIINESPRFLLCVQTKKAVHGRCELREIGGRRGLGVQQVIPFTSQKQSVVISTVADLLGFTQPSDITLTIKKDSSQVGTPVGNSPQHCGVS